MREGEKLRMGKYIGEEAYQECDGEEQTVLTGITGPVKLGCKAFSV